MLVFCVLQLLDAGAAELLQKKEKIFFELAVIPVYEESAGICIIRKAKTFL